MDARIEKIEKGIKVTFPQFPIGFRGKRKGKMLRIGFNQYVSYYYQNRLKVMNKLKEYMQDSMHRNLTKDIKLEYPVYIRAEMYSTIYHAHTRMDKDGVYKTVKNKRWDLNNSTVIYYKAFEDTLTWYELLPDDSIEYVQQSGGITFFPIEDFNKRELIFYITW